MSVAFTPFRRKGVSMKYALLTTVLLATSAFACPDLSGQWSCTKQDGTVYENEIKMVKGVSSTKISIFNNGQFIFSFIANGQPETVMVGPIPMNVTTTCTEFGYKQKSKMVHSQNGGTVAIDMDMNVELVSNDEYVQSTKSKMTISAEGQSESQNLPDDTEHCIRAESNAS